MLSPPKQNNGERINACGAILAQEYRWVKTLFVTSLTMSDSPQNHTETHRKGFFGKVLRVVALHFSVESVSRNQVSRRNLVSETSTTINCGATSACFCGREKEFDIGKAVT
jgi:hypothetical protein